MNVYVPLLCGVLCWRPERVSDTLKLESQIIEARARCGNCTQVLKRVANALNCWAIFKALLRILFNEIKCALLPLMFQMSCYTYILSHPRLRCRILWDSVPGSLPPAMLI